MPINTIINLKVVEKIAKALGDFRQEMLFVGGAVASLYADDPVAADPRPTKDIDISVQIGSYADMNELSVRLQEKGFHPSANSSVMYRYRYEDVSVDFIPYESTPLGPTNSWLKPGFALSTVYKLNDIPINILPVTYFLASKWEAFLSRGNCGSTNEP